MRKLYGKNEVNFALVWIVLYVVVMNIALQFCGGFDDLASKTAGQVLVPVGLIAAVFSMAGHYIGAGLTIKNGTRIVRPVILTVLALLAVKVIGELLAG